MGCDIHSYSERKTEEGWEIIEGLQPFDWRSYGMYGFLAKVRNYSAVPPIADRRGIPDDVSPEVRSEYDRWSCDAHSASWLSVRDLAGFNYDAPMEDRRVTRRVAGGWMNGGQTCDLGEGQQMTFREFLGAAFFDDLEKLKAEGADRVVFWFDN